MKVTNIQQAIEEATKSNKYIKRMWGSWYDPFFKLKLGNSEEDYLLIPYGYKFEKLGRGWQPRLSDIMASDWEICD